MTMNFFYNLKNSFAEHGIKRINKNFSRLEPVEQVFFFIVNRENSF